MKLLLLASDRVYCMPPLASFAADPRTHDVIEKEESDDSMPPLLTVDTKVVHCQRPSNSHDQCQFSNDDVDDDDEEEEEAEDFDDDDMPDMPPLAPLQRPSHQERSNAASSDSDDSMPPLASVNRSHQERSNAASSDSDDSMPPLACVNSGEKRASPGAAQEDASSDSGDSMPPLEYNHKEPAKPPRRSCRDDVGTAIGSQKKNHSTSINSVIIF